MRQQMLEAEIEELKDTVERQKAEITGLQESAAKAKGQRRERMYRNASLERDRANNWSGQ